MGSRERNQIMALIEAEIAAYAAGEPASPAAHVPAAAYRERVVSAFREELVEPEPVTVNFSGGLTQVCWTVTRSNGRYQVIYLPRAGYFSLVIETGFGPVDMGVHGRAIDCFDCV